MHGCAKATLTFVVPAQIMCISTRACNVRQVSGSESAVEPPGRKTMGYGIPSSCDQAFPTLAAQPTDKQHYNSSNVRLVDSRCGASFR